MSDKDRNLKSQTAINNRKLKKQIEKTDEQRDKDR